MNTTSKSDSVPVPVESVADLMDRLGEPPTDIWDRLVADAESELSTAGFEDATGDSVRSPEHRFWQSHGIDHRGKLICLVEDDPDIGSPSIEIESPTDSDSSGLIEEVQVSDQAELASSGPKPKKTSSSKPIIVAAVAAIVLLGAGVYLWPSSDSEMTQASNVGRQAASGSNANADVFDAGFIETTDDSSLELSTLMDAGPLESTAKTGVDSTGIALSSAEILGANTPSNLSTEQPSTSETGGMSSSAFSLDALIPAPVAIESLGDDAAAGSSVDGADDSDGSNSAAMSSLGEPAAASFGGGEEADVMSEGDFDDMDSSVVPAATEESTATDSETLFVSLPPLPSSDLSEAESEPWPVASWLNASLAFASDDTEFAIANVQSGAASIVRSSDQAAIANLSIDADEDATRLDWLAVSQEADRRSLLHGRVELASGRHVYLRPSLRGESIAVDLAERDVKMKWDLSAPPEPKQSRLTINLRVPDGVDVGWIERIENESPRKVRGIAVLSQEDSESVAVVVRLDVQATRMMTVRVRFGARLDPSMPWQWTDRADVSQTLAVVTRRMEVADLRHTELDAAVSRAESSRARRLAARLEQQLDQLESQQKNLRMFAERLAELDQLIATLAGQAHLEAELFVSWPDDEQPILRLTTED
ncbi:hypothetical protein [Rhodopirellula bahusiensis]|uniref:hypothetical protein n=1 Tax=Rhodopirellula bahusiensis TaxID=2014065 RepID=UPI0032660DD5